MKHAVGRRVEQQWTRALAASPRPLPAPPIGQPSLHVVGRELFLTPPDLKSRRDGLFPQLDHCLSGETQKLHCHGQSSNLTSGPSAYPRGQERGTSFFKSWLFVPIFFCASMLAQYFLIFNFHSLLLPWLSGAFPASSFSSSSTMQEPKLLWNRSLEAECSPSRPEKQMFFHSLFMERKKKNKKSRNNCVYQPGPHLSLSSQLTSLHYYNCPANGTWTVPWCTSPSLAVQFWMNSASDQHLTLRHLLSYLVCSVRPFSFSVFHLILLQITILLTQPEIQFALGIFFVFYRKKHFWSENLNSKKVWRAESSERKYLNVKYSWKTTLGKSNCPVFSDGANFFAILPGCSVVGLNWRKSLPCCFFSSPFISISIAP